MIHASTTAANAPPFKIAGRAVMDERILGPGLYPGARFRQAPSPGSLITAREFFFQSHRTPHWMGRCVVLGGREDGQWDGGMCGAREASGGSGAAVRSRRFFIRQSVGHILTLARRAVLVMY